MMASSIYLQNKISYNVSYDALLRHKHKTLIYIDISYVTNIQRIYIYI